MKLFTQKICDKNQMTPAETCVTEVPKNLKSHDLSEHLLGICGLSGTLSCPLGCHMSFCLSWSSTSWNMFTSRVQDPQGPVRNKQCPLMPLLGTLTLSTLPIVLYSRQGICPSAHQWGGKVTFFPGLQKRENQYLLTNNSLFPSTENQTLQCFLPSFNFSFNSSRNWIIPLKLHIT